MFDPANRYAFALDVLNDEPNAHLILADMLEEAGDRANAEFARSKKKKPRKRLDLALGLLPIMPLVKLTCDFAQHPIETYPEQFHSYVFRSGGRGINFIIEKFNLIRGWTTGEGEIKEQEILTTIDQLLETAEQYNERGNDTRDPAHVKSTSTLLESPAIATRAALKNSSSQEKVSEVMSGFSQVGNCARLTANAARKVASLTQYRFVTDNMNWRKELNWQMDATKSLIMDLLKP